MADNLIRNVLQWVTDTASANKAVSEINKVGNVTTAQAKRAADEFTTARRITAQYDDTLGQLGPTASSSLRVLETSMRNGAEETERLKRTTAEAAEEYETLARNANRAASSVQRTASGATQGGRSRLEDVDRFGTFGSQVAGALGGSELGNAIGLVGDLGDGISKLGVAGIAGAGALAAVTLAQQEYNRTVEIGKRNLEGALSAQQIYYNAIQTLSSQQVQEDIAARQRSNELLRERIATLTGAINSAFQQAQSEFGDVAARALEASGQLPTSQLREELNSLQSELTANEQVIGLYTQGLADNRFAVQDAAAAAEQLAELYRQLDQVQLDRVAAELAADGQTAAQRQSRVDDIQREVEAYQRLIDSGTVSEATVADLQSKISGLSIEQEAYANAVKSTADALELAAQKQEAIEQATRDAADALTARNDQYLDAIDREVDAREKALEIQTKISDLAAERDAKLLELQEGYDDRREEIAADGEERRLEAAEDAAKKLADIEKKAGDARNEAVGNRDADAFRLANKSAKEAAEDVKENLDKQNETTAKAQAKQLATLEKGYDRQVQSTVNAANRQITVQQRLVDAQLMLAAQAASNQQFLASNGALSVLNIHGQMWSSLQGQAFVQGQNTVQSFANGVQSALGGAAGGGPNSFPTLSESYGVAMPTARFNKMFDQRYVQIKTAARGGRIVVP